MGANMRVIDEASVYLTLGVAKKNGLFCAVS